MADTESHSAAMRQSPTASISNHVVRVMSEYTGRGPTQARTSIDGDLVSGVEQIMGRKVVAFMSDNHMDPDVAAETFVLATEASPNGQ